MKKLVLLFFFGLFLILFLSSSPLENIVSGGDYRCYAVGSGEQVFTVAGKSVCVNDTYVDGAVAEAVISDGGREEAEEIIEELSAVVLKTEEVEGKTVMYCYTPKLEKTVFLRGLPVNLQIIYGGGKVIAATPIFPESF